MSRDASTNSNIANSFVVISDGILADIARPSLSKGSTRSTSQRSMQSTNLSSFELESLPIEDSSLRIPVEGELYLEAVADYGDNTDFEVRDDGVSSSWLHATSGNIPKDSSSPDMDAEEFEKEIFKLSKRLGKTKQIQKKPSSMEDNSKVSSPVPPTETSQSLNSNIETVAIEPEIDPKINKGMEKIRKLDEILDEKVKLEKEAKAERRRLEQEWQLEIDSFVESCGERKLKPVIQQFLALTSGTRDHCTSDEDYVNPLFQTEVETDFCGVSRSNDNMVLGGNGKNTLTQTEANNDLKRGRKNSLNKEKNEKSQRKDFIKRNKVLAAHANEIISLTDSEKKRLDHLLSDDNDLLLVENPFSKTGQEKSPSGCELYEDAKKALTAIDDELKFLVPHPDSKSIGFTPISYDQLLTGRTANSVYSSKQDDEISEHKHGDRVLKQERHYSCMQRRLQEIDAELRKIDHLEETESQAEIPITSSDMLKQLLEVDSRLTSSALSILYSEKSNFDSARSERKKEDFECALDGDSSFDISRISYKEKSYHDIGV